MLQLNFSSEFYDLTTCVMYSVLIIKLRLVAQYNTVNVELNSRVKTLFKFFCSLNSDYKLNTCENVLILYFSLL